MKKFLLLTLFATLMVGTSYGYKFEKYHGVMFYAMSPDGKYLLSSEDGGALIIYNTETGETTIYEADDNYENYQLGLGNVANNLGMVVGATADNDPAIWENGTWTVLPLKEGVKKGYASMANGISADGKYVVGSISTSQSFGSSSSTTYFPAIWTRGDDGTFGAYEFLPYPEKDFTGRSPQYITAIAISDDGKVVAGQVRSYDGFKNYPIVYTKGEDGTWTYKEYGVDQLVQADVEFPEYPNYEPKASDFMTEENQAAYNEALQLYEDSLDMYYNDEIDEWPSYPSQSDYMTQDDIDAYNEAYEAYNDSVEAFEDVYYEAINDKYYVFNTVGLSANGRYLIQTLEYPDENGDPFDYWSQSNIDTPVLIDLQEDGKLTLTEGTNMGAFGVTNDGMMVASSPAMEYTRNAFVIPAGETKPVKFEEWLATKSDTASIWLKENMLFDVTLSDYDDEGNYTETVVADSLITGSLACSPDGTKFVSYMCNYWAETEEEYGYFSYFIDLDGAETTAIRNLGNTRANAIGISAANGSISLSGDAKSATIYDLSGRTVGLCQAGTPTAVNSGLYIVKATDAYGNVTTKKVRVGK